MTESSSTNLSVPRLALVLIGYRGTGKTTTGRLLARRLGWDFADADHVLEARAGRSIRSIFADDGEPAFREMEEAVIQDLTRVPRQLVLATGGGAILRATNREALRRFGVVVWLKADPEVLMSRLDRDSSRPGLTSAGPLQEIPRVLAERTPLYRETADFEVETQGLSHERVADTLIAQWRRLVESTEPLAKRNGGTP